MPLSDTTIRELRDELDRAYAARDSLSRKIAGLEAILADSPQDEDVASPGSVAGAPQVANGSSVPSKIIAILAQHERPLRAKQIVDALQKAGIEVRAQRVSGELNRLHRANRVRRVGRGRYRAVS